MWYVKFLDAGYSVAFLTREAAEHWARVQNPGARYVITR